MNESLKLLEKRKVMITGGTEGIGRSIAENFLLSGDFHIAICARTREKVAQAKEIFSVAEVVDLSDLSQAKDFSEKVVKDLGGIDFVILNAGVHGVPIKEETTEEADDRTVHTIRVNYEAPVVIAENLKNELKKSKGVLVFISSQHAKFDKDKVPKSARPYADSKRMLEEFFREFAKDPKNEGIFIIGIDPGPVDTNLREEIRTKGPSEMRAVAQRDKDNNLLQDPQIIGRIIYKIITQKVVPNVKSGEYEAVNNGDIVKIGKDYVNFERQHS